ncbi:hypothetical protein [Dolichospermum phage Dfl-JY23]
MTKQYLIKWVENYNDNAKVREFQTNNQQKALMLDEHLSKTNYWYWMYDKGELI